MSTALYRRYRSARFGDLIGQDHLSITLRNEVRSGKVAHAYLFAGMRGTGKTSTARILSRAVNCLQLADGEPCNECQACLDITSTATVDVLEIDAASNRGIDEMRDLRDKVKFLPASLRRKVYIIDEAHMLTTEAWNSLLKTLEEPPEHVLFILATTEPQKIPETVRSRVQRFDFRRVAPDAIAAHIEKVGADEGVSVDSDAALLLARASQGSVRDALSLLEQNIGTGEKQITLDIARSALGFADAARLGQLVLGLAKGDGAAVLGAVDGAVGAGAEPRQLLRDVSRMVRGITLMLVGYTQGTGLDDGERALCEDAATHQADVRWWLDGLDRMAQTELALRQPVDARLQIEQCMLQIACHSSDVPVVASGPALAASTTQPPIPAPAASKPAAPDPASPPSEGGLTTVDAWSAAWPQLIDTINKQEISLAGVLRDCRPIECTDDVLTVGALYTFHLERLQDPAKLAVLVRAVSDMGGRSRKVDVVFRGKEAETQATAAVSDRALTDAVLETFAGSRITTTRIRDRDRG